MALWRSTVIVSAMTMLSRILGLVRDVVLLNVFGAGKDFDTFVVAFRIPNFFRRRAYRVCRQMIPLRVRRIAAVARS